MFVYISYTIVLKSPAEYHISVSNFVVKVPLECTNLYIYSDDDKFWKLIENRNLSTSMVTFMYYIIYHTYYISITTDDNLGSYFPEKIHFF